eukprot:5392583-Pleurochrysis_carterae.AAC.1
MRKSQRIVTSVSCTSLGRSLPSNERRRKRLTFASSVMLNLVLVPFFCSSPVLGGEEEENSFAEVKE